MDLATTTAAGAAQNAAAQAQSLAAAAAAPAGGEFICPRCNVGVGSKETLNYSHCKEYVRRLRRSRWRQQQRQQQRLRLRRLWRSLLQLDTNATGTAREGGRYTSICRFP